MQDQPTTNKNHPTLGGFRLKCEQTTGSKEQKWVYDGNTIKNPSNQKNMDLDFWDDKEGNGVNLWSHMVENNNVGRGQ